MSKHLYPSELKKLKACTECHLVKTYNQFQKEGCENCRISKDAIDERITSKFKGIIAITDPKRSWAARTYLQAASTTVRRTNAASSDSASSSE